MNEHDWSTTTDVQAMLTWLSQQGKLSKRKARLFGVVMSRRLWDRLDDERVRDAVRVAEDHADGKAAEETVQQAYEDHFKASVFSFVGNPLDAVHCALKGDAAWA